MTRYAAQTAVPVGRTRAHIEQLLTQNKADSIGVLTERDRATVVFRIKGWGVRMRITLPTPESRKAEQLARSRWRALFLTLKAKLVSVEAGVETFEEAFLPHLVLPGGATVMDGVRGKLTPGKDLPSLPSGAP